MRKIITLTAFISVIAAAVAAEVKPAPSARDEMLRLLDAQLEGCKRVFNNYEAANILNAAGLTKEELIEKKLTLAEAKEKITISLLLFQYSEYYTLSFYKEVENRYESRTELIPVRSALLKYLRKCTAKQKELEKLALSVNAKYKEYRAGKMAQARYYIYEDEYDKKLERYLKDAFSWYTQMKLEVLLDKALKGIEAAGALDGEAAKEKPLHP